MIPQVKKGFFAQKRPKMAQNWHFGRFGPGHAGFFGALLVGQLVVVARGLYLARHLFTLYNIVQILKCLVASMIVVFVKMKAIGTTPKQ